jgi:hypothetical protein
MNEWQNREAMAGARAEMEAVETTSASSSA